MHVETSTCKVAVILVGFYWNLNILDRFSLKKKPEISSFIKFVQWEPSFLHLDGQTDGHDEAVTRFSEFCEGA
jgi:hypothetical protein